MTTDNVFGEGFAVQRIEAATKDLLAMWFRTYIREVERQNSIPVGVTKIPDPKYFTSRNSFDDIPSSELPKVVVISPGLIGTPTKNGSKQYRAIWRLGVGVATSAPSEDEAKLQADIYGAAVRMLMLDKAKAALGAADINWLDEQYVDLPLSTQLAQYRAASIWFSVDIDNVVRRGGGPATPTDDPQVWPTVKEGGVIIELEREQIG